MQHRALHLSFVGSGNDASIRLGNIDIKSHQFFVRRGGKGFDSMLKLALDSLTHMIASEPTCIFTEFYFLSNLNPVKISGRIFGNILWFAGVRVEGEGVMHPFYKEKNSISTEMAKLHFLSMQLPVGLGK